MLAITRVQMILNQNASVPVNRLPPEILVHILASSSFIPKDRHFLSQRRTTNG